MKSMKLKTTLILLLCSIVFTYSGLAQDSTQLKGFTKPLSLEECIQYGLENNQNLKSVRLQEQIAETQVGETRSLGLPQVGFQAGVNYNYEVQKAFLPAAFTGDTTAGPDESVPLPFGVEYDGNAAFSASQLLFDGSYFVGLQAAKTLRELRQKETNRSEVATVEAITSAFYLVLINQERLELIESNINQLKEILADTKALYENGFAENIAVDRLQVNLNNSLTEQNNTRRNLNYSKNLLKFQMGLKISQPIELQGSLKDLELNAGEYMKEENSFNYEQRPDIQILQVNKRLTELDLKNNKATHLPKLYANWNYGWNTGTNNTSELFDFQDRWLSFGSVGVSIQWNLFTGLRRSSLMERNRIQLDQLNLQEELLQNSIDLEISQNKADLLSATENLEIQKENMKLANKVYKQAQLKYKEGVGSSLELLEAETSKKTAETNYYAALYSAVIAKVSLEKALGILY